MRVSPKQRYGEGLRYANQGPVTHAIMVQEFRPAAGAKVRPLVTGDAGTQFSCDSPAFWKPAFCGAAAVAP